MFKRASVLLYKMNVNNEKYALFGKVIGHAHAENISTVTLTAIGNAGYIMYKREGYTADQIVERTEMEVLQRVFEKLAFPRVYTEPKSSIPVIRIVLGDHARANQGIDLFVEDISEREEEKTLLLTFQYR